MRAGWIGRKVVLLRSRILLGALAEDSKIYRLICATICIFGCALNVTGLVLSFMDFPNWSSFLVVGSLGIGIGNFGLVMLPKSQYKRQEWILDIAGMCPSGRVGEVIGLARKEGEDFVVRVVENLKVSRLVESDRMAIGEILKSSNRAARVAGIRALGGRAGRLNETTI